MHDPHWQPLMRSDEPAAPLQHVLAALQSMRHCSMTVGGEGGEGGSFGGHEMRGGSSARHERVRKAATVPQGIASIRERSKPRPRVVAFQERNG